MLKHEAFNDFSFSTLAYEWPENFRVNIKVQTAYMNLERAHIFSTELFKNEMEERKDFEHLIEHILHNALRPFKCVAVVTDPIYYNLFKQSLLGRSTVMLSFIMVNLRFFPRTIKQ